jgi:dTDP-4-dehydrorhamnose reductase
MIGRHLHRYLEQRGHAVFGTSRGSSTLRTIKFDMREDRLADVFGVDFFRSGPPVAVIVSAGATNVDQCARDPIGTAQLNVDATMRIARESAELNAKLLFFSSNFVFNGKLGYYTDSHPTSPINEYGRQKAAVEAALRAECPSSLVYRLDKVVGTEETEQHIFSEWRQAALYGRPIRCIAGQVMGVTNVDDIARAVDAGVSAGLTGIYNVASQEFFERYELVRIFLDEIGLETAVENAPHDEFAFLTPRPLKIYLDSGRFCADTGLRFTTTRESITAFRKNCCQSAENHAQ